jgi:hypothetical protein
LKKLLRCSGIAAALGQNIEYDAVLVDGSPEIMQHTFDTDEHLIQMPLVSRPRSTPAQLIGEARTELHAPLPNALIRDDHPTFGQQQFDITEAQAKDVVEPDRRG